MQGTILLPLGSRPSMQPLHLSPMRSLRDELHVRFWVRGPAVYLLTYEGWSLCQDPPLDRLVRSE